MARKIVSIVPAQPGWSVTFGSEPHPETVVVWALVEDDAGHQRVEGLTYGASIDLAAYDDCLYHSPEPEGRSPEERRKALANRNLTGRHFVVIDSSQWVETSRGGYLELILKVVKGPTEGVRLIDRLHLQDIDCVQREQGYKRLSDYSRLTGQIQVNDSSQLHGIPFWVEVKEDDTQVAMRLEGCEAGWPHAALFSRVEVLEA